jgi:hypothetical protein
VNFLNWTEPEIFGQNSRTKNWWLRRSSGKLPEPEIKREIRAEF